MKEIKRLYKIYKSASATSDIIDSQLEKALDKDDEHIDTAEVDRLTAEADKAYNKLFKALEDLINAVHVFSGIDKPTIRKMVHMSGFESLMNKIA